MCTDEGRDTGEHRAHRYAQVRAETQVSTGHTGECRAHKCAQVRAGTQVSTEHTGVHR